MNNFRRNARGIPPKPVEQVKKVSEGVNKNKLQTNENLNPAVAAQKTAPTIISTTQNIQSSGCGCNKKTTIDKTKLKNKILNKIFL